MARERRAIFDEDAESYDRARPWYPDALIADLADLAGIGPGRRVAEIGPGTGQATLALADLGASVTAVELGPALARLLGGKVGVRNIGIPVRAAHRALRLSAHQRVCACGGGLVGLKFRVDNVADAGAGGTTGGSV